MSCQNCTPECRYHTPAGCVLELANDGPRTQKEVAAILGVADKRIAQIERRAIRKLVVLMTPILEDLSLDEEWIPVSELGHRYLVSITKQAIQRGNVRGKDVDGDLCVERLSWEAWRATCPDTTRGKNDRTEVSA